jgi:hypothetical protein
MNKQTRSIQLCISRHCFTITHLCGKVNKSIYHYSLNALYIESLLTAGLNHGIMAKGRFHAMQLPFNSTIWSFVV